MTALLTRTALDAGICNVPGVGDIGGLIGLCNAGSGLVGDLNNICTSGAPAPELATSGINSMITTPGGLTTGKTLYDNYGMAGQYWAATGLTCSQMTSSIGNNVAGMVFDMAKSLDRVTITVYQSAAGANILSWLSGSVNQLIKSLGNAIYFPFLAPVVIIAAIWLAWTGLVRKRATRTFEGTVWMVIACAAAIWLIGRPGDFTNVGTTVSNGVTSVLNSAFSNLPATAGSNCLPVAPGDPQSVTAELLVHLGQRPGGPERQRAVDGARLQAVAGRRARHHPVRDQRGSSRRPWSTSTAGSCCGPRRSRPTRPRRARSSTPSRPPTTASRSS